MAVEVEKYLLTGVLDPSQDEAVLDAFEETKLLSRHTIENSFPANCHFGGTNGGMNSTNRKTSFTADLSGVLVIFAAQKTLYDFS